MKIGSSIIQTTKGVLQAGVLSPILFNTYIDGLIKSLELLKIPPKAYDDDLVLIFDKSPN